MKHEKQIFGIPYSWLLAALFLLFLPVLLGLFRIITGFLGVLPSPETTEAKKSELTKKLTAGTAISPEVLQADAKAISHFLGTAYFFLDFRNWSEDEKSTISVVAKYTPSTFPYLEAAYFVDVDRNLRADLKKYLSNSQHDSIMIHVNG